MCNYPIRLRAISPLRLKSNVNNLQPTLQNLGKRLIEIILSLTVVLSAKADPLNILFIAVDARKSRCRGARRSPLGRGTRRR